MPKHDFEMITMIHVLERMIVRGMELHCALLVLRHEALLLALIGDEGTWSDICKMSR
jgi:hypothetical protein